MIASQCMYVYLLYGFKCYELTSGPFPHRPFGDMNVMGQCKSSEVQPTGENDADGLHTGGACEAAVYANL